MIILMHVPGIKARNKKKTIIQHSKDKQTNKTKEQKLRKHKNGPNRGIRYERNKEEETEKLRLGFLGISMRAHT